MSRLVTWRSAPALALLMQVALLGAFLLDTRPLVTNGGLGYDGVEYAATVAWLRGDVSAALHDPYAYRLFPTALVAASGLDVRIGFFVLNVAAILGSSLVLLWMLRRDGAGPARSLLLAAWFALLPTTLRYVLVYPVLVDAVGILLFVGLLAAARARRLGLFAALLVLGALTREHLILLAPLAAWSPGPGRITRAAAAAVPATGALLAAHLALPGVGAPALPYPVFYAALMLANADGEALRLVAAPLITFGVLAGVALAVPRALAQVLGRPGWAYAAAVVILTGAVGGRDHDRYFVWLAAFMVLAAAQVEWPAALAAALTGVHVVATRSLAPLDGSASDYLGFAVIGMPLERLALWAAVGAAATALSVIAVRRSLIPDRHKPAHGSPRLENA